MATIATVTVDPRGLLTDDSTVTIDGVTRVVPTRHSGGGTMASRRILEAVAGMGYTSPRYYDTITQIPGVITFEVEPA